MKIVIIDTGCANLSSVKFALDRLDYQSEISYDIDTIKKADKLLLPGVGTASAAMKTMQERGIIDTIRQLTQPVLGICLGMQLMLDYSAEGELDTLQLMSGKVEKLPNCGLPLPHMGWNTVHFDENEPLFEGIPQDSYFYFVHSFALQPNQHTIATCEYGKPFTAVVKHNNFYGAQFHPERSGQAGAQLLRNFIEKI